MVDSRKTFAVPDVKPPNEFDCVKAKICASVGWLLAASYGGAENVPAELRDPFYCDQYEQEHLKPPVARLLQSSELYCRTYGLLLGHASASAAAAADQPQPDDNAGLLRCLALRGVACRDRHAEVTDADLQHKPIRMSAHLALMDALMSVAAMETVMAVRTSGGGELLGGASSWEEALLHWVNQLNNKLRERSAAAAAAQSDGTQVAAVEAEPQPVQPSLRYRKDKVHFKQNPVFPVVKDVTDLTTGCAIAAVLHYYCPGLLRLQDVCMKEVMTAADSAFNLQLIREFCVSCLRSCCQLSVEDMLYAPPELRRNLLSFLAELLHWFEVRRPEFVQPMESSADGSAAATPSGAGSSSPSIFKKPFLPISSPTPGSLNQSASMSHLEGAGRTWSRKPLSRPLSAVSFSIPFGLDSDVDVVMGNPLITRSVSSDQLGPPPHASTAAAEADLGQLLAKRAAPNGPQRASWVTQTPGPGPGRRKEEEEEEQEEEGGEAGELPTIEEALQIIHNDSKLEPRLHPDGAPDGFYLHSPDGSARSGRAPDPPPVSSSAPSRTGMMFRAESKEAARTRNASECSRDDDSVLRDGSVDSDASEDLPKAQSTPSTPAAAAAAARGQEAPDSGVKMTSFAERKKKQASDSPKAGEAAPGACPQAPEDGGGSPQLNTEMSELGVRLEEKRRAIEAQKKRIEAIFAKHRQRLGKSAFMQLKKEQRGEEEEEEEEEKGRGRAPASPSPSDEELSRLTLEERLARMEAEEEEKERLAEQDGRAGGRQGRLGEKAPASASAPATAAAPGQKMAAPLGDYNNAVSKLTAALSSLQSDMQRLTEQQNQLIHKKTTPNKSWVIPAAAGAAAGPPPGRLSRESTRDLPSSSPSPSRKLSSQATPPKSPQVVHRRAQSAPPKSPKHQQHARSLDSRPALSRVLTPPRNVDRIPHLRRVNPSRSQVQTSSSFSIGDSGSFDDLRSLGATPLPTPVPGRTPHADSDAMSEAGSDYQSIFSMELETGPPHRKEGPAGGSSGAPSECSFESDAPSTPMNGKRGSLIEISLSALRGDGEDEDEDAPAPHPHALSDSTSERAQPEMKGGVGFFFKDDKERTEDEMAQRRAALLEKQQKRTEEMRRRKQEQEKESNKPQWMIIEGWGNKGEDGGQTPDTPPPPPRTPPPQPEGTPVRRGDFTRQEYERRQQLKIMEDLDKVLRQKPTTVRAVKKQRPKTVFRDDSALAHSPVKGLTGSRLNKVYSHSTMNLSSMTHDAGTHTLRRPNSRSHSPARLRSPGRHRDNGERDWENGSTISSPASIPEYTGPKLYKEPSFKSNKFIIHNAITRCCLAGKVNEPHKNKIVEEMEKSSANHFLILFRDSSCQFRAVYTMNPETEELQRLTGVGPRLITPDMVESIYKYTSDRKQFTVIPSKTMSMSVDAFTIPGHFWQKRPGTPKKLAAPK